MLTEADSAVIVLDIATNFKNYHDLNGDPETLTASRLKSAAHKYYERLRHNHVAHYQKLFRRVSLDLGNTEAANAPTDERLKRFSSNLDPQLAALYF